MPVTAVTGRDPHLDAALRHLVSLQRPNGCWEGEMVWCTMILSQVVIVRHVAGCPFAERERAGIIRHYEVTRRPDGAWGLHPESPGYVFTTTLAYVALRLLGLPADHPMVAAARQWLQKQPGGVLAIPTWGKFWLALIDLYGWGGVNAAPAELFSLPRWLPFHPAQYYCHTRYIYLGMAYLHGQRFDLGPITQDLRRELYREPYEVIDFAAHRGDVAETDLYVRPGPLLRLGQSLLALYERMPLAGWRRRARANCLERILYEQRASRYHGLSPVNALLNCLALLAHDPQHPELRPSIDGIEAWRCPDDAEGIRYCGARSNTWDTAFALQAVLEFVVPPSGGQRPEDRLKAELQTLRHGYDFLRGAQLTEDLTAAEAEAQRGDGRSPRCASASAAERQREARDPTLGGWCFSDGRHRWPVSDCTAEALCAIHAVHAHPDIAVDRIPAQRLQQAVQFILQRQNTDGGFGTYERRRGARFLERLNPSEMYGQCMTELSYLECTASCVAALAHHRGLPEVDRSIERGVRFLRTCQHADGAFPGFWGINFTYGTFHAVKGLRAAGVSVDDPVLTRAVRWLTSKQRGDGGWGEHWSSCLTGRYVEHAESQVVMTSWALLALLDVLPPDEPAIERGIRWLRARQNADGSWPQQGVNGVFFGTAMLDYRLYKSYFPTWALARYSALQSS